MKWFKKFKLSFELRNRWRHQWRGYGWFIIWLGTEWVCGSEYLHIRNIRTLDVTIANIGFRLTIAGPPPMSEAFYKIEKFTPHRQEGE
jgi:hypothetical protein